VKGKKDWEGENSLSAVPVCLARGFVSKERSRTLQLGENQRKSKYNLGGGGRGEKACQGMRYSLSNSSKKQGCIKTGITTEQKGSIS